MIRAALLAAGLLVGQAAQAATLTIGMQGDPTSLDPQFFNSTANDSYARDVYDHLVDTDATGAIIADLATRWRIVDATTWEFTLRPGVTFSDGTKLTADDVVFSMKRGCCIPNSPYSLGTYLRGKTFTAIDAETVRVTTTAPAPTMLEDLARIAIVSAKSGDRSTAEYNAGHGSPGTGPYRLVDRVPGDRVVLEARTDWWGGKPAWDKVLLRAIPSDGPRVAGLLTGELDLIDAVPPTDAARIANTASTRLDKSASNRMVHLRMDIIRDQTPDVRAADGSALLDNPLRKLAVRQALSQSISRQALVDRIMDGLAVPASQFAAPGTPEYNPDLQVLPYDPAAAKAKLAAAGYPNGFRMILHGPNDRLVNDAKIVEAVAQMFSRIGVHTDVDTVPSSVFFPRTLRNDYSIYLTSWGLYDLVNTVRANLHTPDTAHGYGVANATNYANPAIDKLTEEAIVTVDASKRRDLLQQAIRLGVDDVALIPLFNLVNVWGTRKGLSYLPRSDGTTVAESVSRTGP